MYAASLHLGDFALNSVRVVRGLPFELSRREFLFRLHNCYGATSPLLVSSSDEITQSRQAGG